MKKTIFITGATDGIGLVTAKTLAKAGHNLIVHGRNAEKMAALVSTLTNIANVGNIKSYLADLSDLASVQQLAEDVKAENDHIDGLINNAGIFKTSNPITDSGIDVRFVVNTISPYYLTRALLPIMNATSRVINLSSAAQASVVIDALLGKLPLNDMGAYAQSKLAITMWTRYMAKHAQENSPSFIAVNPGSLLASKMVKEGFGVPGNDIQIGADILIKAALDDSFSNVSGQYFDNDAKQFANPHTDALDDQKVKAVVDAIESLL